MNELRTAQSAIDSRYKKHGLCFSFSKMRKFESFNSNRACVMSPDADNNAIIIQILEDIASVLEKVSVLVHHSYKPSTLVGKNKRYGTFGEYHLNALIKSTTRSSF